MRRSWMLGTTALFVSAQAFSQTPPTGGASGGGTNNPGGISGQIQINSGSAFGGVTPSGDVASFNATTGAFVIGSIGGTAVSLPNSSYLNLSQSAAKFEIGGINALSFPSADSTLGQSIVIGNSPLPNATSISDDIVAGNGALSSLTTGSRIIAIGAGAAAAIQTTSDVIAIGHNALHVFSDQNPASPIYQLLAIGTGALGSVNPSSGGTSQSSSDVAVGYESLGLLTSGGENTAFGYVTLGTNVTGNFNTAMGDRAGGAVQCTDFGSGNSFFGSDSGRNMGCNSLDNTGFGVSTFKYANTNLVTGGGTIGGYNVAVGSNAMSNYVGTDTVGGNVAVGANALTFISTGGYAKTSTAIGYGSLYNGSNTQSLTGVTALGYGSGQNLINSSNDVIIGYNVASSSATFTGGSNDILIGTSYTTDAPAATINNYLNIDNFITGTMGTGAKAMSIGGSLITTGAGLDLSALSGPVLLPTGTLTTGTAGELRYNSSVPAVQAYLGGAWVSLGGGSGAIPSGSSFTIGGINALSFPSADTISGRSIDIGNGLLSNATTISGDISIGYGDLVAVTTGSNLIAIGTGAMQGIQTNSDNIAIGASALSVASDQGGVVPQLLAIGSGALRNVNPSTGGTSQSNADIGIGYLSLGQLVSGTQNTAVGYDSLTTDVTGGYNTGVGMSAGRAIACTDLGNNNSFFGDESGSHIGCNSANNTGVGAYALEYANTLLTSGGGTIGGYNVGVGVNALKYYTGTDAAAGNVAIGASAMAFKSTGGYAINTTGIGYQSLNNSSNTQSLTSVVAVGASTGTNLTTANNVILIGQNVASSSATFTGGTNDILIGTSYTTDAPSATISNYLNIDNFITGTMGTGAKAMSIGGSLITAGSGLDLSALSGPVLLPSSTGTTGVAGELRYNSSTASAQVYQGSAWVNLGNGPTGTPTVTGGTSPAVDTYANNRSGMITFGSGTVTTGTLTFANSGYTTWDHCTVTSQSAQITYGYNLTSITVTGTSLTSAKVDYACQGV